MDGLLVLVLVILFFMFGPPFLFLILGFVKRKKNRDTSNVFFILAFVWLIIGAGICAAM